MDNQMQSRVSDGRLLYLLISNAINEINPIQFTSRPSLFVMFQLPRMVRCKERD